MNTALKGEIPSWGKPIPPHLQDAIRAYIDDVVANVWKQVGEVQDEFIRAVWAGADDRRMRSLHYLFCGENAKTAAECEGNPLMRDLGNGYCITLEVVPERIDVRAWPLEG